MTTGKTQAATKTAATPKSPAAAPPASPARSPWPALWALVIGFFMILVDTTIVAVANPAIKSALDPATPDLDNVVWVTSAYLLTYAVPLLITGRLGDRFGPRNIYLLGLAVFTLASLWCGLSNSLGMLVAARALQGLGAALMTPQTMAVITRTFPPDRRGAAMGLWGATAGVAMLVGPLAGGLLVDGPGWEWIFFVNVPVGALAFVLAWRLVPKLETHPHRFDILGVVLSAVGVFLLVFGLQEGERYDWGTGIWTLIAGGVVVLGLFLWQQSRTTSEPLVPFELFRDRNFSISNLAIAVVGFAVTTMALPLMFYVQLARDLTPTRSALLLVPMAVAAGVLAQPAGRLLDKVDPRFLLVPGLSLVSLSLIWYSLLIHANASIWQFLLPATLMGIGNAGMWGPLATTATRNLPPRQAGAGAGIYNTTRTIGSVIGSAAMAAFMQGRLEANLPGLAEHGEFGGGGQMPAFVLDGFSKAMAQSVLLPALMMVVGVAAVFFLRRHNAAQAATWQASRTSAEQAAPAVAQKATEVSQRGAGAGRKSAAVGRKGAVAGGQKAGANGGQARGSAGKTSPAAGSGRRAGRP